jgi:hypothetical protein
MLLLQGGIVIWDGFNKKFRSELHVFVRFGPFSLPPGSTSPQPNLNGYVSLGLWNVEPRELKDLKVKVPGAREVTKGQLGDPRIQWTLCRRGL